MKRKWTEQDLHDAVRRSGSVRQVLSALGLREAGGNYTTIRQAITKARIDTAHFHGQGWRKGYHKPSVAPQPTANLLVENSTFQSFKLKKRLFQEGYKEPKCELCGWAKRSVDGRIPLELDHINGIHSDNRLSNLRILCPNCHSLQATHRGRNKKRR